MYIFLTLFFISLLSIVFMIMRKLVLVKNGKVEHREHSHPFVPDLQKIKHSTFRNIKKYEHLTLVMILRFYVRFLNFLKYTYQELKIKIKKMINKNKNGSAKDSAEKQEISKFLKIISEYKQKIRNIKHRVTEEEEGL